jgi:amidase
MHEDTAVTLEVKGLSGGYGRVPILHGLDFPSAQMKLLAFLATMAWIRPRSLKP